MSRYDSYNREERAICSHLFRLLHENLSDKHGSPFFKFLSLLSDKPMTFGGSPFDLTRLKFKNIAVYSEVSIIRDYYQHLKPSHNSFMESLSLLIMEQEGVSNCRRYSDLPSPLNDHRNTHPNQIRRKAKTLNIDLTEDEQRAYGAMQGMFNAKPDLVLTIDDYLLVCEAKLTEPFDLDQLERTRNITQVWATLMYEEFGFDHPPECLVFTLGAQQYNPDISWEDILQIAEVTYDDNDRSRLAFQYGKEIH